MKNKKIAIEAMKEVLKTIQDNEFSIDIYEENKKECGLELERWTDGGVDMIPFLDFRDSNNINIFNIYEEIKRYARNFDVDEEIDMYREDEAYKNNFTYRESIKDFEDWQEKINKLKDDVKLTIDKYNTLTNEDFENLNIKIEELL